VPIEEAEQMYIAVKEAAGAGPPRSISGDAFCSMHLVEYGAPSVRAGIAVGRI
jgi:hypothetical protein